MLDCAADAELESAIAEAIDVKSFHAATDFSGGGFLILFAIPRAGPDGFAGEVSNNYFFAILMRFPFHAALFIAHLEGAALMDFDAAHAGSGVGEVGGVGIELKFDVTDLFFEDLKPLLHVFGELVGGDFFEGAEFGGVSQGGWATAEFDIEGDGVALMDEIDVEGLAGLVAADGGAEFESGGNGFACDAGDDIVTGDAGVGGGAIDLEGIDHEAGAWFEVEVVGDFGGHGNGADAEECGLFGLRVWWRGEWLGSSWLGDCER